VLRDLGAPMLAFDDVLGRTSEYPVERDWSETEPGFREMVDEVRRLLRRGRKRRLLAAFLTLLLTGALAARQATNVRRYPARVVLGVTENSHLTEGPVQASNDLRSYVLSAVFTDASLLHVLEKDHYAPAKVASQPRLALEDIRDQIEVDVTKNEFAVPRTPGETRSALVAIELWLPDPDQAISITRDLGDLVVERDQENQLERLRLDRGIATRAVSVAQSDLDRMHREIARDAIALGSADPRRASELRVQIDNANRSLLAATTRLDDAIKQRRALDTVGATMTESVALRWDRVDWGTAAFRVDERASAVEVTVGGLLVLFPLVLLGVGAWNRTVYDDRDVRWLGLLALGVVRVGGARAS
jgi:hypothetical protein